MNDRAAIKIGDEVAYIRATWAKSGYGSDGSDYQDGYEVAHGTVVSFDDETVVIEGDDRKRLVFAQRGRVFSESGEAFEAQEELEHKEYPENAWKWR